MNGCRTLRLLTCAYLVAFACMGQQSPGPKFEIASVKRLPPGQLGRNSAEFTPAGFEADGAFMVRLISTAYQVPIELIEGKAEALGKGLMPRARPPVYNISAKASDPMPRAAIRLMLQDLLVERFQLKFHTRRQTEEVLALIVSKDGLKIEPAGSSAQPGGIRFVTGGIEGNASLDSLANVLMGALLPERVVNLTGLDGAYRINLKAEQGVSRMNPFIERADAEARFRAALRTVGLDLTRRKIEAEYFVVDSMLTTPTEN